MYKEENICVSSSPSNEGGKERVDDRTSSSIEKGEKTFSYSGEYYDNNPDTMGIIRIELTGI